MASLSCTISVKPASLTQPSNLGPGQGSIPFFRVPSMNRLAPFSIDESSLTEPSGEVQLMSMSWSSIHPPGFRLLCEEDQPNRSQDRSVRHVFCCGKDGMTGKGKLYVLVTITDQFWPIADGRCHAARMYVVELLGVGPFRLDVVNFEPDVRWHPVTVNIFARPVQTERLHAYQRG